MTGAIEAAGDIASGALLGRAVEPRAGESRDGAHGTGLCLNCGTALIGNYCHACGQSGHVHRTLTSIGHDLLHGAFHFEGKIWRTLPMLVLHPGALTRRYIAGERARFVSPLALFLFFVFLMFATIHTFAGEAELPASTNAARMHAAESLDADIAKAKTKLAAAQAADAGAHRSRPSEETASAQKAIDGMQVARRTLAPDNSDGRETSFITNVKTGWARLDHNIAKANENPNLALYKLQSSAYKYSWALIPISVPFVALLFLWRRRFKLYDHTIFVTYSLDFMTLLVSALILGGGIGISTGLISTVGTFAPPVHMFVQLRGAYGLRWFSALWRTIFLITFAWIALVLFAILLLGMGLME